MLTRHFIVRGVVQGVGFRHFTLRTAIRYDIRGTVRNTWEGDVEVYAQGDPPNLTLFEEQLHRGPFAARVEQVVRREFDSPDSFSDFDVVY